MDARHLEVRPELTAFSEIEHNDHGDRKFLFEEFGASGAYHPSWEPQNERQRLNHIHFCLLSGAEEVCASPKEGRATLSIDWAVNAARVPMDIAFGSVGEDEVSGRGELERLLSAGQPIVVVTRGAKGAIATSGAQRWTITGQKITVKDTTGAGDTFIAWFLVVWKETGDIQRALGKATQKAASPCGPLGGFIQDDHVLINR